MSFQIGLEGRKARTRSNGEGKRIPRFGTLEGEGALTTCLQLELRGRNLPLRAGAEHTVGNVIFNDVCKVLWSEIVQRGITEGGHFMVNTFRDWKAME